jgi:hypothetical protein
MLYILYLTWWFFGPAGTGGMWLNRGVVQQEGMRMLVWGVWTMVVGMVCVACLDGMLVWVRYGMRVSCGRGEGHDVMDMM